ncbi:MULTISPECIES: TetR/AcrR family transcriptional regulator [Actinoalloteichus]|uniref:Transcriptional regulator, TetR family n=1 Tax=Actinoalloteichus fjordicus TaxID=1612552 RepID=A0AAC9LBM3_9PSEU|nr:MULTISPECIES: TetR/AcrR family transcriptional regulator [Actinoalloteichus]APU14592.1 transcriptional regulator, TetR family [Actinoalloteichus fjordicus]APU20560.1 transcriptional regulator, TetR family [Actinoalloteichus sp. GBA129-24]
MPERQSRRALLAEAAIEVLAREGGRGLTHRAVDREAAQPEGTTADLFPSRESLMEAIAAHMSEQHRAAVRALHEQRPEVVTAEDVDHLYRAMLVRSTLDGRAQFLALVELYLEAVRRPSIRAALGEMVTANIDSAVALHREAGRTLRHEEAGRLDAYFLGLAVSLLALPGDVLHRGGLDDPGALAPALRAAASMPTVSD